MGCFWVINSYVPHLIACWLCHECYIAFVDATQLINVCRLALSSGPTSECTPSTACCIKNCVLFVFIIWEQWFPNLHIYNVLVL